MDHSTVVITHLNMTGISRLLTVQAQAWQKYFRSISKTCPYRCSIGNHPKARLFSGFSLVTRVKYLDNVPSVYNGILNGNEITIHGELLVL